MLKQLKLKQIPAPLLFASNSPQYYVELITKAAPDWSIILKQKHITSTRTLCALFTAAVCRANACRINEILALESQHLTPSGMAVIVGSKGSNARLINTFLPADLAVSLHANHPRARLFPLTYKEVWNAVAGNGLAVQEPGHTNNAVTHQGRYQLMQSMQGVVGAVNVGQALGHRSKNTAEYYANPQGNKRRSMVRKLMDAHWTLKCQGPQLPGFLEEL